VVMSRNSSADANEDGRPLTAKERRRLKAKARKGGGHHRTEENHTSRHYGGKYERERRKGKQPTCRVCGGPHERRACPGIEDDGTALSWFKGKGKKQGGRGRLVDQSGQWAGWQKRKNAKRAGPVDPQKYLRRFSKLDAPDAHGAPVVDACCNLVQLYDKLCLASAAGNRASSEECAVPLEEVCPLQSTFAGCVASLTELADFPKRFTLRTGDESSIIPVSCGVAPTSPDLAGCGKWAETVVAEFLESVRAKLVEAFSSNDCVACSCGLDYSKSVESPRAVQKRLLAVQVQAAVAAKKPILLTVRPELRHAEAFDEARIDLLSVLQETMAPDHPFALNSWAGDAETAVKLCNFFPRCFVGLCGIATFSKAVHMRELCFDVPNDRLLFTTDAPNTPTSAVGAAGIPSLPSHTPYIALAVATQKRIPVQTVLEHAANNARKFFGLSFDLSESTTSAQSNHASEAATTKAPSLDASKQDQSVDTVASKEVAAGGATAVADDKRDGNTGRSSQKKATSSTKRFKCNRCKKKCKAVVREVWEVKFVPNEQSLTLFQLFARLVSTTAQALGPASFATCNSARGIESQKCISAKNCLKKMIPRAIEPLW